MSVTFSCWFGAWMALAVGQAEVPRSAAPLLDATFASDASPFAVVSGEARFEQDSAWIAAGTHFMLRSSEPVGGDIEVALSFIGRFQGEAVIRLAGLPALGARFSPERASLRCETLARGSDGAISSEREHSFATPTKLRLRIRNVGVEFDIDGTSCVALPLPAPLGGGAIEIELTPSADVRLDSLRVERLPYQDRDQVIGLGVIGLGAGRLARLAELPSERFKLLEPLPRHLDPVYRVGIAGEDEPLVVLGRGFRSDESSIPLLDQALALAQIKPWIHLEFASGDGGPDSVKIPCPAEATAVTIETPPGVIRVDTLCGVVSDWPVLVVSDVTRNRVLIRTNPGGPANADAWSTIPKQCQRLRIVLSVPGRPSIEREIDVVRP